MAFSQRHGSPTPARASLSGGGDPGLAETDQRKVAERRHQAALDQLHSTRARQPSGITRPGEFGGPEAERAYHRLQPLLDAPAHARIGADPGEDDQFTARAQHAG